MAQNRISSERERKAKNECMRADEVSIYGIRHKDVAGTTTFKENI